MGIRSAGLVLMLALLLAAWSRPAAARSSHVQGPAMVSIRPAALSLSPGESGELIIAIEQAQQVFGLEVRLGFDPTVIQVVDADDARAGVQIQDGGFLDTSQGFVVANQADNETGMMSFAMVLLAPAAPVSGSGSLINLSVRAADPGSSPLSLTVTLASMEGQALPVEVNGGNVLVAESQPPAMLTPPTPLTTPTTDPMMSPTPSVEQEVEPTQPAGGPGGSGQEIPPIETTSVAIAGSGSSPIAGDQGPGDISVTALDPTAATDPNPTPRARTGSALAGVEVPLPDPSDDASKPVGDREVVAEAQSVKAIDNDQNADSQSAGEQAESLDTPWLALAIAFILLPGLLISLWFMVRRRGAG